LVKHVSRHNISSVKTKIVSKRLYSPASFEVTSS